ncbi:ThuA domain-containing protein [Mariniflexile sp.]|uniref:ThuA domain-containing protein n=1 Tax=Mariniflexile sp. TaxID=1979402 RepID=UPI004047F1C9
MTKKTNGVHLTRLLICFYALLVSNIIWSQENLKVLVLTKTNGFRHKSIPKGIEKMKDWSKVEHWNIEFSEDSTRINDMVLDKTDVLVFLNTKGNILGTPEKEALVRYINKGGGFVGVHLASGTETDWPWFHQMIGAEFKDHPEVQSASMFVDHTFQHPAVNHLGETFEIVDEWYNFKEPILPHVNVVLTLDENSYTGEKMGGAHPIAWYHYYEGGRVFYTGLGHTDEIYENEDYRKHIVGAINWAGKKIDVPTPKKWENLLDGGLKKWDKYIGIPKPSVDMSHIPNNETRDITKPLGFNNDPKQVYSIVTEKGMPMLHITGEIFGGISTKQEYSNYHFKTKFKWLGKKWGSKDSRRDSGILYHCVGRQGTYASAWMSSLQSQIQEKHFGDFIAMGDVSVQAHVDSIHVVNGEVRGIYNPKAKLVDVGRSIKNDDMEKPMGEWNTLEVICLGTSSIHIINGKVVSAIENAKSTLKSIPQPLSSGRILLQSEGAEAYYKDIKIKGITEIPTKYKKQIEKLKNSN